MESIKKLAIFLKLYNAYDAYMLNINKSMCEKDDSSYISGAFVWSKTKEGDDFWRKLDRKWRLFLENRTMLEIKDMIKLFDISYEISKGASGYYLYNIDGSNAEIFKKLGLNIDDYDVGLGGIFPYRMTINELQELTIELAEKVIDKTGIGTRFVAIFRDDYEYYYKEAKQPEKEESNQESTEKDCSITEPIITIKKHKKQTFVL